MVPRLFTTADNRQLIAMSDFDSILIETAIHAWNNLKLIMQIIYNFLLPKTNKNHDLKDVL